MHVLFSTVPVSCFRLRLCPSSLSSETQNERKCSVEGLGLGLYVFYGVCKKVIITAHGA